MTTTLILRDIVDDDLPIFFEQQLDPTANYMAAFTAKDPTDRAAFDAHWHRIRIDAGTLNKTIVVDGQVVGHIASFEQFGEREVSYWIGREYWGRGFATRGLLAFLRHETTRPLHARAVKDNLASLAVLQKCGFAIVGEDRGFANARGAEVEEYILRLDL
jgi:RimJ/RimL family protein N-acetyltransferase